MPVSNAIEKIKTSVMEWEGVTNKPHRYGGLEFNLGKREIGHIHGNYVVDIPFTKKIKSEIIAAGLAKVHHILPKSGWISKYLTNQEDVDTAVKLLHKSFNLATEQKSKRITIV